MDIVQNLSLLSLIADMHAGKTSAIFELAKQVTGRDLGEVRSALEPLVNQAAEKGDLTGLLASPQVQQLLQKMRNETQEANSKVFSRCPYCRRTFLQRFQ